MTVVEFLRRTAVNSPRLHQFLVSSPRLGRKNSWRSQFHIHTPILRDSRIVLIAITDAGSIRRVMAKATRSREPRTRSSKLTLVLDANSIIARRYRLDGPLFAVIERAVSLRKLELAIPRIVVEEVQNKFREEISKANHRISSEISKLNPLLPQGLQRTFAPLEVDKITADFVRRLSKRLDELQASRPGYAKIPNSAIVARDLARRRPFQESGRGYRDTLLWETIVLDVASNASTTVLVTENKKDFCADDTNTVLHPDLVADLKSRGFREEAIDVCPTIESFVDQYVGQLLPTSAEVLAQIQSGRYKMFSFSAFFEEHREEIQKQLSRESDRSGTLGVDYIEGENPEVVYVEDPSSAEIREAYELDSQKLFLSYDVTPT